MTYTDATGRYEIRGIGSASRISVMTSAGDTLEQRTFTPSESVVDVTVSRQ